MCSTQFPISFLRYEGEKYKFEKDTVRVLWRKERVGGGGKGITGEGIISLLYEEKNAFFTFLFIICVTVENIYHSGDAYTGASSSSAFMPQLWYGSTQIGFDLKFNHNVRDWSWYIPNKKGGERGGGGGPVWVIITFTWFPSKVL